MTTTVERLPETDYIPIMVERIVANFHPLRIILFGSQARGEAGQYSDVDLLVVFAEDVDRRYMAIEIHRVLSDLPVFKDIIVTTLDEIARRGDLIGTVLRPALREGKTIYESTANSERGQTVAALRS